MFYMTSSVLSGCPPLLLSSLFTRSIAHSSLFSNPWGIFPPSKIICVVEAPLTVAPVMNTLYLDEEYPQFVVVAAAALTY
mmetsp:Transcript_17540/g.28700  ORF Transcript_17540/g.28700 Transcript_17540/m.28700 type:complete len:80 (-) Transcript_17540:266-505(-)